MIRVWIMLVGFSLFAQSCAEYKPYYYEPSMQNIPIIKEKGQAVVNYGGNFYSENSISLNSAYGITNFLAGMLNMHIAGKNVFGTPINHYNLYLIETGLGPYYNVTPWLLVDLYPTFAIGKLKNQFDAQGSPVYIEGRLSTRLIRFAAQPSINFHHKYISLSFSSRFSTYSYENITGDLVYKNVNQIQFLKDRSINNIIEPAITFKVGFKNFKLMGQWQKTHNFSNYDLEGTYDLMAFGLVYTFKIKSKDKE